MGDKAVNNEERRIRQGGTLGKGVFFCLGGNIFFEIGRRRREEEWRPCIYFCAYRLEDFHRGHLLLGILGSGARKP
jgi:hypothetical protein